MHKYFVRFCLAPHTSGLFSTTINWPVAVNKGDILHLSAPADSVDWADWAKKTKNWVVDQVIHVANLKNNEYKETHVWVSPHEELAE